MNFKAALLVVGLCSLNTGCVYYAIAARNLAEAPVNAVDEVWIRHRNKRLGREAWDAVRDADPGHNYSRDYECGFVEGFADYLDAGGRGNPPEMPPYRYRKSCSQTPQGVQATLDWFAGFRHGAAVAKGSGLREVMVVHTATPGPFAEFDSSVRLSRSTAATAVIQSEPLPPPKKDEPPAEPDRKKAGPSKLAEQKAVPVPGSIILDGNEPAPPPFVRPSAPGPVPGTIIIEKPR